MGKEKTKNENLIWIHLFNVLLSICLVVIISEYPILGRTTYGKPGMWYVMGLSVISQLIIIGITVITKAILIGDLYQGIWLFVFVSFTLITFLCLTGALELVSISVSAIGIANCGHYFILRIRNGENYS